MKQYGRMKVTEFSKKQIGVIYMNAKNGNIRLEKWVANRLYDLADYYGCDDRNVEESEKHIMKILEAIFSKDFDKAQDLIDYYTEDAFGKLSRKNKEKANRNLVD